MPYNNSYRYRRYRKYRRYNRKLTYRNIYMNRSAKSQATQIAALKKKVNKVFKATKPETKVIIESTANQFTMSSAALGNTEWGSGNLFISVGPADNQRIGDNILRKDYWYITFEYYNTSDTGYHNSESSGTPIRIISGGWKTSQNSYDLVPTAASIISNYSNSGADSSMACLSPLVNGVTATHNIYYDKTFTITAERNQKVVKVKTPWYKARFDSDGYANHSWLICKASGLHWDANFTESVLVTIVRKTVFRDA